MTSKSMHYGNTMTGNNDVDRLAEGYFDLNLTCTMRYCTCFIGIRIPVSVYRTHVSISL